MADQGHGSAVPREFSERYAVRRLLGSGGMGTVYEVYDRQRDAVVALKTLPQVEAHALYLFKNEFRALADITHRNLVALYELASVDDQWFFTMERIEGVSFLDSVRLPVAPGKATPPPDEALTRGPGARPAGEVTEVRRGLHRGAQVSPRSDEPAPGFDEERLRQALPQLVRGLMALHEAGRLHRDIKPSNVLVDRQGRVVICDFGLVTEIARESHRLSEEGRRYSGTVPYMSPEQGSGSPLSSASDWYSVGVMLYQTLTGHAPFEGDPSSVLELKRMLEPVSPLGRVPGVPEDLALLCDDLLRTDPAKRPDGRAILERLGRRDSHPPRWNVPRVEAFVGREGQLAELRSAAQRVEAGIPETVFVHGSSGIGKTALVHHFLDELRFQGRFRILESRCYERESVPFKAVDSLIDRLTAHLCSLPSDRVRAVLPPDPAALARLFPVIRRVPDIEAAAQGGATPRDPHELRRRAFAALRTLLSRLASKEPLVLFIDDLQWGDIDSGVLLSELLRPPNAPGLLLIGTYRSEDRGASALLSVLDERSEEHQQPVRELRLEPLSREEVRTLMEPLLQPEEGFAEYDSVSTLAEEAGGSPLFALQLARHASRGKTVSHGSSGFSLEEILRRHVEDLPEPARDLLTLVAVAGRPIRQDILSAAARLGTDEPAAVARLHNESLLRTTGARVEDAVEVYHDRIREAIIGALSETERARYHSRLARAYEALQSTDAEALFEHYRAIGEVERAAAYAETAALQALETLAFDQAARFFRVAIELGDGEPESRRELFAQLAEALVGAGRGAEAARAYLAAAEGDPSEHALDLRRRAAMHLIFAGRIDEGVAVMRDVLGRVGLSLAPTPYHALASLLTGRAKIRLRGLHYDERDSNTVSSSTLTITDACWAASAGLSAVDTIRAFDFQTRHMLAALECGEPHRVARAIAVETAHTAVNGRSAIPRVEVMYRRARGLAKRLGDPYLVALAMMCRGVAHYMHGDWQDARDLCSEAEGVFRGQCTGVQWERDTADSFGTWAVAMQGDFAELYDRVPQMMEEAYGRGDLYAATNIGTLVRPVLRLGKGESRRAQEELDALLRSWSRASFQVQHLNAMISQCQIHLHQNDAAAHAFMSEQWPRVRNSLLLYMQLPRVRVSYLCGRAALVQLLRHPRQLSLRAAVAGRIARLHRERAFWVAPHRMQLEGALWWHLGRRRRALSRLEAAARAFVEADLRMEGAATDHLVGRLRGGEAGRQQQRRVEAWLAGQGVSDLEGLLNVYAPVLSA